MKKITEIRGKYFEEFNEGDIFTTSRRTLRESDLLDFCNLCWFNLSMFFDEIYGVFQVSEGGFKTDPVV